MTATSGICSVPGCGRPLCAKGWCNSHYLRVRLTGELRPEDPIGYKPPKKQRAPMRRVCMCTFHSGDERWHGAKVGFTYHKCRCEKCVQANRQWDRDRWWQRYASKYGISLKSLLEMLEGATCAICGTDDPGRRAWHIDHDHACCPGKRICGKCIRGVLCFECNYALGNMRDDPARLRAAADYLDRWTARKS